MPAPKDLAGLRFGSLVAISHVGFDKFGNRLWRCRCDCGYEKITRAGNLTGGRITSCGCVGKAAISAACIKRSTKHGHSKRSGQSRVYTIWGGLAYRQQYKEQPPVCERWRNSFEDFLADMGEPPTNKHTIDRIDNAKGYDPGNCRWATMTEQENNRTNNRRLAHNGEEMTLQQWSRRTGIKRETIARRMDKLGWSVEEALTLPLHSRR